MASSDVEIANIALVLCGADTITSFSDTARRARVCLSQYANERDATLRAYPWNFAVKRVQLAPQVPAPSFGWQNAFTVPGDNLRILTIDDGKTDYDVESGVILADTSLLNVRYIARIEDPTKYDSLFVQALGARLAYRISFELVQSAAHRDGLWEAYRRTLKEARAIDAQEGRITKLDSSTWDDARDIGTLGQYEIPVR